MKFIIDKNLSFKIKFCINTSFPETIHVDTVGLSAANDTEIWNFAKANDYIIISKDNDFNTMSNFFGCPPKIVQLICGNKSTKEICEKLTDNIDSINRFLISNECLLKIS